MTFNNIKFLHICALLAELVIKTKCNTLIGSSQEPFISAMVTTLSKPYDKSSTLISALI